MKAHLTFLMLLITMGTWCQVEQVGSGNCLTYDGVDDYVDVPYSPSLDFGSGDFTLEAWVYLNSLTKGSIVSSADNYSDVGFDLRIRSGSILFACGCPSAAAPCNNNGSGVLSSSFATGEWVHVAGVRSGNNVYLYNNGVLVASGPLSTSTQILTSGKPVRIGRSHSDITGPDFHLDGQIDEVRIWSRALTQTELQQNMAQKYADCADPSLVGYWRMDEGADGSCTGGQDVCDASCNGNHGTKF